MGTLILSDISEEEVKSRLNKWLAAAPDDFREQAQAYADKELKSLVFLKEQLAKEPPKVQDAVKQLVLLKTKKAFLGSSSDTRKVHFQAIMKELNEGEATTVRKILADHGVCLLWKRNVVADFRATRKNWAWYRNPQKVKDYSAAF